MATSLPLPRGFFNAASMRLSEDQRRQYIEYAESSIRKVFALSDCHRNSWIPVRDKKGVAVFRNFGQTRGPQAYKSNIAEVGGKADVQASLDEIARAYAAHDDALFSRLMKKLNAGVLDAAVLCTIVPRSPLAPFRYIGIKWFAVKTPTPLVSHRDYCCLEVQDKIVDAYGNEMYIRILNSIEINECPSLENSHGLVRAKMLAGYMYRADRAEPTVVRIHHVARFDPSGYFPSQWAYKTAESQLVSSVVQIKRVVEKQQMNACTFVDKKQWVPNHERLHCAVCSRPFGTFRPRHHCRCCGEVICGKCSIFKSVDVPGTTLKNVRICSICNMGVQKSRGASGQHDGANDDAMSDISTSSVTSSSTLAHNEMNLMDLYLSANGNPNTPSAYSTASAQSNLSMRSTASSRSVMDARHRAATSASTPVTARFFKGGSGSGGQSIFGSSSRATSVTAPTSTHNRNAPRSFFNDTNTPRSYIGGSATPSRQHGIGFGPASAATTPSHGAMHDDDSGAQTPSGHEERMSVFKQNPLDLGYLRDSVRMTQTSPTTETTSTETTTTEPPLAVLVPMVAPVAEPETTPAVPTSTTPTRMRGESTCEMLPPAKMPRLDLATEAEDVEMEDDSTTNAETNAETNANMAEVEAAERESELETKPAAVVSAYPLAEEIPAATSTASNDDRDEPVRPTANSTSTTESSRGVTAPVQPLSSSVESSRKSFLSGLFSRASLDTKPPAAA